MPEAILLQDVEQLGEQGHRRRRLEGLPPQLPHPAQASPQPATKGALEAARRASRGRRSAPPSRRRARPREGAELLNKTVLTIEPAGRRGRPPVRLGHHPGHRRRHQGGARHRRRPPQGPPRGAHQPRRHLHGRRRGRRRRHGDGQDDRLRALARRPAAHASRRARAGPSVDVADVARPSCRTAASRIARVDRRRLCDGSAANLRKERQGRLRDGRARALRSPGPMSTATPTHGNGNGSGPPARSPAWAPRRTRSRPSSPSSAPSCSPSASHYAFVIEEGLKPEDFYRERHRTIYESMLALYEASEPIDVLTVTEHLRSRGKLEEPAATAEIDASPAPSPRSATLRRYGAHRQRALAPAPPARHDLRDPGRASPATRRSRATSSSAPSASCSRSPTTTARRTSRRSARSSTSRSPSGSSSRPRAARSPARPRASPTSTRSPAASSPATSIIIAARPSMGKSALVTNIAENVALDRERPRPVALFSLEMSEAELAQRFIASQASIKGDDLRKGRLKDESQVEARAEGRRASYDAAPLFIDDSLGHRHPRGAREGAAAAPADARRPRRPGADHRRLPAAPARGLAHREPRPAGRRDVARAEDPRARAARARSSRSRSSPVASSRARTSGRCSPTCASPARSSRTPTS